MPSIQSKDGTSIAVYHWKNEQPRAQVILIHGFGEHAMRYDEVALTLVEAGCDVHSYDHRGHGRSSGPRGYIDNFGQYLDDLDAVLAHCDASLAGKPRFVVAHSMGGLVALMSLVDRKPVWKGLVLSSPFLKVKLKVPAWKSLAAHAASKVYPQLSLPSGLKGNEAARDPEIARAYDTDTLNLKAATARWYVECLAAQDRVFAEASTIELPLLLLHGEADVIADPQASATLFPRLGSRDKTLALITGAYHEIFNEPPAERKAVYARVAEWLAAHM